MTHQGAFWTSPARRATTAAGRRGRAVPKRGSAAAYARKDRKAAPADIPEEDPTFVPNEDQARALEEIVAACAPNHRHLVTGEAGTGKTSLLRLVVRRFLREGKSVVCTAPTHQAVKVLRRKLDDAGLGMVDCRTIQSLLCLRPVTQGDRQVFERRRSPPPEPVMEDVVVCDEASMPDSTLMSHIRTYLPMSFVLFLGDDAQLPPVGEDESEAFQTRSRSHLSKVVRQAEGNPILAAAHIVRRNQREDHVDWSWAAKATAGRTGVFTPTPRAAEEAMRKAFTSDEFERDPDTFRYLAWRNETVDRTNERVRFWRYGEGAWESPLAEGERAMFRRPAMRGDGVLFATNEEATVKAIRKGVFEHDIWRMAHLPSWTVRFPSWEMDFTTADGRDVTLHMPQDHADLQRALDRLRAEAGELHGAEARERWESFHGLLNTLADLRPVYAITVHSSQGSTFRHVFLDVADIGLCVRRRPLEGKRMVYTALTRPTDAVVLVNL